ncbi:MAG: Fe-Mn family superoxide dismutase [Candidatus Colwellbacteria bacterium]|nr:Fe-Mn family superoxide dismutase [Candidatus Colwellbacteria bacterium]MDD3752817.1 Fe-Mn family superoxide dismutase [Candidatus Colwellbacteria bacterium]MDD4819112.1 Fe-Mn family superoxide dismutase [Candidatus Colwellbacteria bacterium]
MTNLFVPNELAITRDLDGISLKAIEEHFKLYEGYVKKTNEIREKIASADKESANTTYSEIGELKRQESFAIDGMKLHAIYFGILGGNGEPVGKVADMIIRDFGSIESWKEDMTAAGLSARGWVITSYDLDEKVLKNYSADAHNVGIIAGTVPIIPLDVYEHAYYMDYGTNRKGYIEAFFRNLDWEKINELAEKYID